MPLEHLEVEVVVAGILVVLGPSLTGGADSGSLVWALVLMSSCIPMCFSSVFKEKALGDVVSQRAAFGGPGVR